MAGLFALVGLGCTPTTSQIRAEANANQIQSLQQRLQDESSKTVALRRQVEELETKLTISKEALDQQGLEKGKADEARKALLAKLQSDVQGTPCEVSLQRDSCVLTTRFSFEPGSTELDAQARSDLQKIAKAIIDNFPKATLLVAGHADNTAITIANYKSNWELSGARALSVMQFLVTEKIPPQKIGYAGFGEFRPVADNNTPEGREKNRRIEIIVTP